MIFYLIQTLPPPLVGNIHPFPSDLSSFFPGRKHTDCVFSHPIPGELFGDVC